MANLNLFETQAELANLLNFVKIKNRLNMSNLKILFNYRHKCVQNTEKCFQRKSEI